MLQCELGASDHPHFCSSGCKAVIKRWAFSSLRQRDNTRPNISLPWWRQDIHCQLISILGSTEEVHTHTQVLSFCLCSDGEGGRGSLWESQQSINFHKLTNKIVFFYLKETIQGRMKEWLLYAERLDSCMNFIDSKVSTMLHDEEACVDVNVLSQKIENVEACIILVSHLIIQL